jgi:TetR/AcrR family transcriptional repressor of nem operon
MSTTHQALETRQHIIDTARRLMACRGYTAVGLNELLKAADVPKGSFYYYFDSKEAFGQALLDVYFASYLAEMETTLTDGPGSAADRLMGYWVQWLQIQGHGDPEGKCLAVKLGAEVSDLSDPMRQVLCRGTQSIIRRLARAIEDGLSDGSLEHVISPDGLAEMLYQVWLGASLLAKMTGDSKPLKAALVSTAKLLHLDPTQPT